MELWQVRYFLAVADTLHFGRAAERLNVAQPSVTRAVQALEKEIKTQLLRRDRRIVVLTPAGVAFAAETRETLARLEAATRLAQRTAAGAAGCLIIGFEGSAAFAFIPRSVAKFRTRYPEISVELREMPSGNQLAGLRRRQLDLGFIVSVAEDPAVVIEVMQREPIVVAMPAAHPLARHRAVTAAQLARQKLILALPGDVCGSTIAMRAVLGEPPPKSAILVSDMQLRLSFVAAGEGVALILSRRPCWAGNRLPSGHCVRRCEWTSRSHVCGS